MKSIYNRIQKAENSAFQLWLLNQVLKYAIPFNRPHGFKLHSIGSHDVKTFAPYRKKNFNHLKGIHACAIATVAELAAGLVLMRHFSPGKYRFIMSSLHVDYHFQAKKDILAQAVISEEEKNKILEQLKTADKLLHEVVTTVHDIDNAHIATVKTVWQIKAWSAVRTKV